jgi:hypothetical protein
LGWQPNRITTTLSQSPNDLQIGFGKICKGKIAPFFTKPGFPCSPGGNHLQQLQLSASSEHGLHKNNFQDIFEHKNNFEVFALYAF